MNKGKRVFHPHVEVVKQENETGIKEEPVEQVTSHLVNHLLSY